MGASTVLQFRCGNVCVSQNVRSEGEYIRIVYGKSEFRFELTLILYVIMCRTTTLINTIVSAANMIFIACRKNCFVFSEYKM